MDDIIPSASGRFLLRLDRTLHARLREEAGAAGLSLNEYCARRLSVPAAPLPEPAARAVERCATALGAGLAGVVAFGSWAKGGARAGSDVDLLIVIAPDVPVVRALYRPWDHEPLLWEGRPVEPHFVHLPAEGARVSGLWAEAALDGIVLYERDFAVSRRLVHVRRLVLEGALVRRWVHGQPYWVEAA